MDPGPDGLDGTRGCRGRSWSRKMILQSINVLIHASKPPQSSFLNYYNPSFWLLVICLPFFLFLSLLFTPFRSVINLPHYQWVLCEVFCVITVICLGFIYTHRKFLPRVTYKGIKSFSHKEVCWMYDTFLLPGLLGFNIFFFLRGLFQSHSNSSRANLPNADDAGTRRWEESHLTEQKIHARYLKI